MSRAQRALLLLLLGALAGASQPEPGEAQTSAGRALAQAVVTPKAYVSLEPVPRGRSFEVAVLAQVRDGYHINAHKVADPYLIPTTVDAKMPPGIRVLEASYPPGEWRKLSFAADKLLVYSGRVTVRLRAEAGREAALGTQKLNLVLGYQACNDSACLPPVKIPIELALQVAPAGAAARAMHQEVFGRP